MGKSLTNNTCQIVLEQPNAYGMEKEESVSSYIKRNISALFQEAATAISLHICVSLCCRFHIFSSLITSSFHRCWKRGIKWKGVFNKFPWLSSVSPNNYHERFTKLFLQCIKPVTLYASFQLLSQLLNINTLKVKLVTKVLKTGSNSFPVSLCSLGRMRVIFAYFLIEYKGFYVYLPSSSLTVSCLVIRFSISKSLTEQLKTTYHM
jgi:hypothetical protein